MYGNTITPLQQNAGKLMEDLRNAEGKINKLDAEKAAAIAAAAAAVVNADAAGPSGNVPPPPLGPLPPQNKNYAILSTIPIFTGSHKEKIELFLTKIEQARAIAGWSDLDALNITKQKLEKEALEFSICDDNCKSAKTYEEIKKALTHRYKKKNTDRFYRELVSAMRRTEKEPPLVPTST